MGETTSIKPIPTLTLPLKGREAGAPIIAHYFAVGAEICESRSSPFKGEARRGMGETTSIKPIPTLTLPLKGREAGAPIIAHYFAVGSVM